MAYSLLSRIPDGVAPLLKIYEGFIASKGRDIMAKAGNTILKVLLHIKFLLGSNRHSLSQDPREFVEALMALHLKYDSFCTQVFRADAAFTAAVDKVRWDVSYIVINLHTCRVGFHDHHQ